MLTAIPPPILERNEDTAISVISPTIMSGTLRLDLWLGLAREPLAIDAVALNIPNTIFMAINPAKAIALAMQVKNSQTAMLLSENIVAANPETTLVPPARKRYFASILCIMFDSAFTLSPLWATIY